MKEGPQDADYIEVTLAASEALSDVADRELEVRTSKADDLYVYVDGGSAGSAAPTYDLEIDRYAVDSENWLNHAQRTNSTAFMANEDAVPTRMRVDLTNTSAGSGTYRIEAVSVYR